MKGDGVIRGLRLEPELADLILQLAQERAEALGEEPNAAATARHLMRIGSGRWTAVSSAEREGFFRGVAEAKRRFAESAT